ncbi:hypothetical protein A5N15_00675 [Rothia kristinae]|uniref:Uncharacterized protein n=1 Tax=Rothia kristinae TaxID=37923 RepID=A0A657IW49_9MICC|nr:hypothetical protein A5N15_00675 [Rothia kristinae]
MRILSWACTRACGPGPHGDPLLLEDPQVLGGHVLVVEGHDVHPAGELPQDGQVGVVPNGGVGDDGGGAGFGGFGQHAQLDAQLGGLRDIMAGQLPSADHADHGCGHR